MARPCVAAEGAHMKSKAAIPPRWAEAMLRSFLKPSDRESTSGDLLEEYRAARHPALGGLRADAWYVKHVLSVLLRLTWPCVVAVAALALLPLAVQSRRFSPVPAPAISLFHCVIYLWAGYHGSHITRLIKTGTLGAAITSFFALTFTLAFAAIQTPGLLLAPFSKPFIFVILSILLLMALGCGILMGTIGAVFGRWFRPTAPLEVRAS